MALTIKFRRGPVSIPLDEDTREFLVDHMRKNYLSVSELAARIKIKPAGMYGLLKGATGCRRARHKRIMEYANRVREQNRQDSKE